MTKIAEKLKLSPLAALLAATALSTPVLAQDVTSNLDTVTVVATRSAQSTLDVPAIVDVVDADASSIENSSNLSDVFADLPGVNFEGTGRRNGQNPSMRGYDQDAIIVTFDGVRQNFQSQHDGNIFIDPEVIKQVEVVRGSSSALYGSGGLGGVIAFDTKDAADFLTPGDNFGFTTATGYQDVNGEWMASGTVYGRNETVDAIANLNYRESGDIELGDGNELNADDEVFSGLAKLNWSPVLNHTLSFSVLGYQNDAIEPNNPQIAPGDPAGDQLVDKTAESVTASIGYAFSSPDNPWIDLKAKAYITDTSVDETVQVATTTNAVGDVLGRQLDTWGINIDNQSRVTTGNLEHTFSYGVEYYEDEQDGSDSANGERGGVPDSQAEYFGAYLQNEILWSLGTAGKLLLVPGVRFDQYESNSAAGLSNSDEQVSPKLGVTYMPNDWFRLFASYAEGFRAPNFNEVYTTGTHFTIPGPFGGTNTFVPNPALRPETNKTVEVGFAFDKQGVLQDNDRVRFKAAYFDTQSEDYIEAAVMFTPFPACCGTTTSVNVDEASLDGWDASLSYQVGTWLFGASYAVVEGTDDATGDFLTNVIPDTFVLSLEKDILGWGALAGWRSTIVAEHDQVNDPADARDSYVKHDAYYTWRPTKGAGQGLRFDVGIDNIFDEDYSAVFADATAPGRNVKVKVTKAW